MGEGAFLSVLSSDADHTSAQANIVAAYTVIAIFYCIVSAILYAWLGYTPLVAVHVVAGVLVAGNYVVLRRHGDLEKAAHVILFTGTMVVSALFATGGWEKTGMLWTFAYLPYAFFLARPPVARFWVATLVVVEGLIAHLGFSGGLPFPYTHVEVAMFGASLAVFLLCMFLFQRASLRAEGMAVERAKEAEQARLEVQRHQTLLEQAQSMAKMGSWEWDVKADRVLWSPELYRIFGIEPEGFTPTYQGYLDALPPGDRERADAVIKQAFGGTDAYAFDHRVIRPDGTTRWIRGTGQVERRGNDVVRMTGTAQDITDQRLADERFAQVVESAPDAIVLVDDKGKIVLVNGEAENLFGWGRADMMGQPVDMLIPDGVRGNHEAHRESYKKSPTRRPMGRGLDLLARRKDGREVPVEISLSPIQTAAGLQVMATVRDVSDRRRQEMERRENARRIQEIESLKELSQMKSDFLNTAAHELATPLTPLRLQMHMLKEATHDKREAALAVMDRNVERLGQLVGDLLDGARLQSNHISLERVDADLVNLARQSVEGQRAVAQAKHIRLDIQEKGPVMVHVDRRRMAQVLDNLLTNAVKFSPANAVVLVRVGQNASGPFVSVRDEGIGFTAQAGERLFQPFSRVHDTQKHNQPGTGLGLYICKGLVEAHGGRIRAESPGPEKGATFTVELPGG